MPCYKVNTIFLKFIQLKYGVKSPYLWAQYQSSSDHYILKYIVLHKNLMKCHTQPGPVAPQPSQRPYYNVSMFFLIHTTNRWNQIIMLTDTIWVNFWPKNTKIYSSTEVSNEMTDPTRISSTTTKTQTMLPSL
jgi:hypothetical protein